MNWKRGLLRAWLLMTGLWLALNVVFFRPDVEVRTFWEFSEVEAVGAQPTAPKDPTVGTTRTPPPQRPRELLGLGEEVQPSAPVALREQIERLRRELLEPPLPPHLDETQRLARAKENLQFFALTAFLLPAILFVIGAGGLWIFRGFRRGDA